LDPVRSHQATIFVEIHFI